MFWKQTSLRRQAPLHHKCWNTAFTYWLLLEKPTRYLVHYISKGSWGRKKCNYFPSSQIQDLFNDHTLLQTATWRQKYREFRKKMTNRLDVCYCIVALLSSGSGVITDLYFRSLSAVLRKRYVNLTRWGCTQERITQIAPSQNSHPIIPGLVLNSRIWLRNAMAKDTKFVLIDGGTFGIERDNYEAGESGAGLGAPRPSPTRGNPGNVHSRRAQTVRFVRDFEILAHRR